MKHGQRVPSSTGKNNRLRMVLSSTALVSTLAVATWGTAQEAVPVSGDQFGYDTYNGDAVAGVSGKFDLFGGGDDNGALYGGAPSIAIPIGHNFGLQFDAIAGVAADEAGFAGGAAQFFARDPMQGMIGAGVGGYYIEGMKQYGASAIAEYYLDNVTLEALAGYQWGDVVEESFYGRLGASIYVNPDLRLGAGVAYDEETGWGGDVGAEAYIADVPGMALFANGYFDEDGVTGVGGVRFYLTPATSLVSSDRTKQAGGVTLMSLQRTGVLRNFFQYSGSGFGLRQISLAGGGSLPGDGNGGNGGNGGDGGNGGGDGGGDGGGGDGGGEGSNGLIDTVQDVVDNALGGTALDPVVDLVDTLVDPETGALAPLTGALNDATDSNTNAPLSPVNDIVDSLAGGSGSSLGGTVDGVQDLVSQDANSGDYNGGLIDLVQDVVGNALDGTALQPLADGVDTLVDPETGALAPLTSALNDATDVPSNAPLAAVTEIVDSLAGTNGSLLGSTTNGAQDLLSQDANSGGTSNGLIEEVQYVVSDLLVGTPLEPLAGAVDMLVDPVTGALAPLTAPLNDATDIGMNGPLASVTEIVDGLAGPDNGELAPVVDAVNELLSGSTLGGGIPGLPTGGSNPLEGVPVLGDLVGALTSLGGGGLPGLPTDGSNPLEGVPVLGDLVGALTSLGGGLPGGGGTVDGGAISEVQAVVDTLLAGTPLAAVEDLVNQLVDPSTGALAALTGPLDEATDITSGPLAPVTQLVDALVGPENGALDPVLEAVNDLLSGQVPSLPGGGSNPLDGVPVLGDLVGALTDLGSGGLPTDGLDGIPVIGDLVAALTSLGSGGLPTDGLDGIPVIGDLVATLTSLGSGGLPTDGLDGIPVLGDLVATLTSLGSGGLPTDGLDGIPVLGDLLGTLTGLASLPGGVDAGTIDVVQAVVGSLLGGTPLEAVGDVVDGLVDPDLGALAALTGPLNDATSMVSGPLGPVTMLVESLVGPDVGALDPVLDLVHGLLAGDLSGLSAGGLPLSGLGDLGSLTDLLGGLSSGGLPLTSLGDLGSLTGLLAGLSSGGLPDTSALTSIPVLGTLIETLIAGFDPSSNPLGALTGLLPA